ncbi:MAG: 30S ribosomal protein S20 [Phycisphaerales bacterium]|nr:30S ribosomal protein S20 [Phycisphaerales bacterium]
MAHSLSAKKRIRQNAKARMLNKARTSALKTRIRKVADALHGHDVAAAEGACQQAIQLLDREASRGLVHRNTAARRKSRMAARLAEMKRKHHA